MKIRALLCLAIFLTALFACDDEAKSDPKFYFKTEERSFSLDRAKIYLAEESFVDDRVVRKYIVTDGTYRNDGGWGVEDLRDASYSVSILFSMGGELDFVSGDFRALHLLYFYEFPNDNVGYFNFGWGSEDHYEEIEVDSNHDSIIAVSGGYEDGDTMTIQFDDVHLDIIRNGGFEESIGTFYVTNRVIDARVSN